MEQLKSEYGSKVDAQSQRWQGILKNAFETINSSRDTSPTNNKNNNNEIVLPFKIISPRSHRPHDDTLLVYTSLTNDKNSILNAVPLQTRRKSKLL